MCCQIVPFGTEWGHAPSVLIVGGTGGNAGLSYKGVFPGMAGATVLPPEPHVLVLHGLSRYGDP